MRGLCRWSGVRLVLTAALLLGSLAASAQELRKQAIPFTVWLDFRALSQPNAPRLALPIWLESIVSEHPPRARNERLSTVYRLRLRRLGDLNKELHFRIFFEDEAWATPRVTAWSETGTQLYQSGTLGDGLGFTNSAELLIPTQGVDYVEVAVPGDGRSLHGAFLSSVATSKAKATLDFNRDHEFLDPFGKEHSLTLQEADSYLFGRVRAALLAEAVKLPVEEPIALDFQLDRAPQLALLTFEVLNADVSYPPHVVLAGATLGAAQVHMPDLADPGYRGQAVLGQQELRFRYAGWLRCEKLIPASSLRAGINQLSIALPRNSRPVAIRAVEIQLKYPVEGSATP